MYVEHMYIVFSYIFTTTIFFWMNIKKVCGVVSKTYLFYVFLWNYFFSNITNYVCHLYSVLKVLIFELAIAAQPLRLCFCRS